MRIDRVQNSTGVGLLMTLAVLAWTGTAQAQSLDEIIEAAVEATGGRQAIERLGAPREVMGAGMLMIATGGLAVNLAGLWVLSPGGESNPNMRGASLHVIVRATGRHGAIPPGVR